MTFYAFPLYKRKIILILILSLSLTDISELQMISFLITKYRHFSLKKHEKI